MNKNDSRTNLFIGSLVIAICMYLSFMGFSPFESLEKRIYEIEMRLDTPRNPSESKVAIVNIDDKSIRKLGKWPWPRHIIAEMIKILKSNGAKFIGIDMIFSEKEQNPGMKEIEKLYSKILKRETSYAKEKKDTWILAELKEIEKRLDNDKVLSETVKNSGNIILPVVGEFGKYQTELVISSESFLNLSVFKNDSINIKDSRSVRELTTPFNELLKSSHALGHINLSPNKIMMGQVHIPFINYRGHIIPSMPLRLVLDYINKHPDQVVIKGSGIKIGEEIIPTSNGEMFIKFKGGRRSFPYYSFIDILNVKKVPAVFDDKIVLSLVLQPKEALQ
ncbi:MAG: CHASE2 domain-containing protein [Deltaproteobacteria bacterium]|nr:CHASE2 domain-containing protein [Deltaproteobacteria bacterium]